MTPLRSLILSLAGRIDAEEIAMKQKNMVKNFGRSMVNKLMIAKRLVI